MTYTPYSPPSPPSLTATITAPAQQDTRAAFSLVVTPAGGTPGYSYAWTWSRRPVGAAATFSATNVANPTVTPDAEGDWEAQVVVTDAALATVTLYTTITVGVEGRFQVLTSDNHALFDVADWKVGGDGVKIPAIGGVPQSCKFYAAGTAVGTVNALGPDGTGTILQRTAGASGNIWLAIGSYFGDLAGFDDDKWQIFQAIVKCDAIPNTGERVLFSGGNQTTSPWGTANQAYRDVIRDAGGALDWETCNGAGVPTARGDWGAIPTYLRFQFEKYHQHLRSYCEATASTALWDPSTISHVLPYYAQINVFATQESIVTVYPATFTPVGWIVNFREAAGTQTIHLLKTRWLQGAAKVT